MLATRSILFRSLPRRTVALTNNLWTTSSSSPLPKHTDHAYVPSTLTDLFDQALSPDALLSPTGIFDQPLLKDPAGLHQVAEHVSRRATLLLHRIHRAPSNGDRELRLVIKNFDRLSDLLCGIIDMCEVVWTVHPEAIWRDTAEEVYGGLCRLMNEMNVDTKLYQVRSFLLPPKKTYRD